jgi:soluble lytic murein transglycosylase-like protein
LGGRLSVGQIVALRQRIHVVEIIVASLILSFLLAYSACAEGIAPSRKLTEAEKDLRRAKAIAEDEARKRGLGAELSAKNMKVFLGTDGVATLTNRPEKFRGRAEYVEILMQYDPIVVPNRLKRYKSTKVYAPDDVKEIVREYAKKYSLDENLVYALIRVESNFNPNAVSPAGARGLMQLMPGTALDMGVTDIFDPVQNVAGGTQYLAKMLTLFDNDVTLALAAYNAGPEAVKRHDGIPPYEETQNYVRLVTGHYQGFAGGSEKTVQLAQTSKPLTSYVPKKDEGKFMVQFKSGLTQPADLVEDEGDYYRVKIYRRIALVKKIHVAKIVAPKA